MKRSPIPAAITMLARVADEVGARLFAERNPRFLQKHYDPAYPILSLLEDFAAIRAAESD